MLKLVPFSPLLLACLSPSFARWQQVDISGLVMYGGDVPFDIDVSPYFLHLFADCALKNSTGIRRRNEKSTSQKYDLK